MYKPKRDYLDACVDEFMKVNLVFRNEYRRKRIYDSLGQHIETRDIIYRNVIRSNEDDGLVAVIYSEPQCARLEYRDHVYEQNGNEMNLVKLSKPSIVPHLQDYYLRFDGMKIGVRKRRFKEQIANATRRLSQKIKEPIEVFDDFIFNRLVRLLNF